MSLTLSIITPSYNQGDFIERTIQSILGQNIPQLEYCIFDGGSTDHTLEIIKKYQSHLFFESKPDRGQAHAVNKGLLQTKGAIIGWLNSDDIYYPNALSTILSFFEAYPTIDIVYGNANHIDENDSIIEPYYTESWNVEKLYEVCFLSQPAVFFRRRILASLGILNENLCYCMDYEYWLRAAQQNVKFYYLPILLAGSRLHLKTKTLNARIKVHAEINTMLKQHLKRVPERWLINYAHAIAEARYPHYSPLEKRRVIAIQSFLAAFAWNKKITFSYLRLILKWFISSLYEKQH